MGAFQQVSRSWLVATVIRESVYCIRDKKALLLNLRHTCHVETSNDISWTALPVASYFWHSTEVHLWTFQLSILWWISNLFKPIHTLINIACCSHKRVYVHYYSFQRGTSSLFHVCYFSVIIFKPHWFEWPFSPIRSLRVSTLHIELIPNYMFGQKWQQNSSSERMNERSVFSTHFNNSFSRMSNYNLHMRSSPQNVQ